MRFATLTLYLFSLQLGFSFQSETPTKEEIHQFKMQQAAYKTGQKANRRAQKQFAKAQRNAFKRARKSNSHAPRTRTR